MEKNKRYYINLEKLPEGKRYSVSEEPGPNTIATTNNQETLKAILRLCDS